MCAWRCPGRRGRSRCAVRSWVSSRGSRSSGPQICRATSCTCIAVGRYGLGDVACARGRCGTGGGRWERGAVMKCASHAVEKRLGSARHTFSSVISDCHVQSVDGGGSVTLAMLSSVAIACSDGVAKKSVVGEQPKNGSGWAIKDFLRWAEAALVSRFWKEPRSCHDTRYCRGSIDANFFGMVMASASGWA
eukprot:scaffold248417_cov67-Attheya_sp.AAC.7